MVLGLGHVSKARDCFVANTAGTETPFKDSNTYDFPQMPILTGIPYTCSEQRPNNHRACSGA